MNHTPLPWVLRDNTDFAYDEMGHYMSGLVIESDDGDTNIAEMCGALPPLEAIHNADLIVKAVNNHHTLVETLQACEMFLRDYALMTSDADLLEHVQGVLKNLES